MPKHPLLILLVIFGISGCDAREQDNSHIQYSKDTLALVNNEPINQTYFDRYAAERLNQRANSFDKSQQSTILDELINIQLIIQEANRTGFSKRPDVQTELHFLHNKLLTKMMLKEALGNLDLSDKKLREAYQKRKQRSYYKYKARHILLNTEQDALSIIQQLKAGQSFSALAKKYSLGTSGKQGGNLGWFTHESMDQTFTNAVAQMDKGSFTVTPVHTQFGWHVILLEDKQKTDMATFEEMKPSLEKTVREQALQHYISKLKQRATIQVRQ